MTRSVAQKSDKPALSAKAVKDRGWTAAMIRDFLGNPDRIAPNSMYGKKAARVKLYLEDRVQKAEETDAFKQRMKKANARREAQTAARPAQERQVRYDNLPEPPARRVQGLPMGAQGSPPSADSPRRWDRFQLDAMDSIDSGRSVLVCAPTGSGKTAIAEYAVSKAMSELSSAIYTTPIKALSNQKYRDLSSELGAHNVGLLTGDVTINSDAPVVVMTTEVLRNMVYSEDGPDRLRKVSWVILDEVHYLQDKSRGAVWEEIIINAPQSIKLVCLSATIGNSDEFAGWLKERRGQLDLIRTDTRPVPLTHWHLVGDGRTESMRAVKLLKNSGVPNTEPDRYFKDRYLQKSHWVPNDDFNYDYGYRPYREWRFSTPSTIGTVKLLKTHRQLPALYFIFSRDGCEAAAAALYVRRDSLGLTTEGEQEKIRKIASEALAALDPQDRITAQADLWMKRLEAGVAAHHAGLLPVFKEAVEQCFAAGLVKVVFATETMALGVNMPARSVVLDKLTKWDGTAHDILTSMTYAQISGRAGRRGIDTEGHVISLWSPYVEYSDAAALAAQSDHRLKSSFALNYNMVANLIWNFDEPTARSRWGSSFAEYQGRTKYTGARKAVVKIEAELSRVEGLLDPQIADYLSLEEKVRKARAKASEGVLDIGAGDVIKISGTTYAVVKSTPADNGTRFWTVDRRGKVAKREPHPDRKIKVVGHLGFDLPEVARTKVRNTDYSEAALALAERTWVSSLANPDTSANAEQMADMLAAHPAKSRPDLTEALAVQRDYESEAADLRGRLEKASARMAVHDMTQLNKSFDAILHILERLRYTDGWDLTAKGEVLREFHGPQALLLAESLTEGCFAGLDDCDLAAVVSSMTNERRPLHEDADSGIARFAKISEPASAAMREVKAIHDKIVVLEKSRTDITHSMNLEQCRPIHAWVSGGMLSNALAAGGDMSAGDFCRAAMMLSDTMRQIAAASPCRHLSAQASRVARNLLSGPVGASAAVRPTPEVIDPAASAEETARDEGPP